MVTPRSGCQAGKVLLLLPGSFSLDHLFDSFVWDALDLLDWPAAVLVKTLPTKAFKAARPSIEAARTVPLSPGTAAIKPRAAAAPRAIFITLEG